MPKLDSYRDVLFLLLAVKERPVGKTAEACGLVSSHERLQIERPVESLHETLGDGRAIRKFLERESEHLDPVADPIDVNATVSGIESMVRFTRLREHARGGLGKVSLARDERLRRGQVPALRSVMPSVDRGLEAICRTAMAAETGYFAESVPWNDRKTAPTFDIVRDRPEFREILQSR